MCNRTRWGRIDPSVAVDLMPGHTGRELHLDQGTLPGYVRQQLLLMASPSAFLNYLNKFRLDTLLINHHLKGVYTTRTSAAVTNLAMHAWRQMSIVDRQPYMQLAAEAQQVQQARLLHFLGSQRS
ncbi:uncharacterized protein LOC116804957 [Drosophila grimshawi]|uniref:uncharacterized protein LOC116804957 n=1 Tax=Drosophila grimshawi TaxID=7222 RepID=UPI000C86E812|nr:uncharacterized protein LOC116804957 [Drosophila grimshawi]